MTDPTIRAALEAAGEAARVAMAQDGTCPSLGGFVCTSPPCRCARDASVAAVAAFLNAQPPPAQTIRLYFGEVSQQGMRDIYAYHRWLAAVVAAEQPAKEGEQ
jgi:hypothetical protein